MTSEAVKRARLCKGRGHPEEVFEWLYRSEDEARQCLDEAGIANARVRPLDPETWALFPARPGSGVQTLGRQAL